MKELRPIPSLAEIKSSYRVRLLKAGSAVGGVLTGGYFLQSATRELLNNGETLISQLPTLAAGIGTETALLLAVPKAIDMALERQRSAKLNKQKRDLNKSFDIEVDEGNPQAKLFKQRMMNIPPYIPSVNRRIPVEAFGLERYGIHSVSRYTAAILASHENIETPGENQYDLYIKDFEQSGYYGQHGEINQEFNSRKKWKDEYRGLIFQTKEQGLVFIARKFLTGGERETTNSDTSKDSELIMSALKQYGISFAAEWNPKPPSQHDDWALTQNGKVLFRRTGSEARMQTPEDSYLNTIAQANGFTNNEYMRFRLSYQLPERKKH